VVDQAAVGDPADAVDPDVGHVGGGGAVDNLLAGVRVAVLALASRTVSELGVARSAMTIQHARPAWLPYSRA
jgi:hypothetical protein